MSNTAVDVHTPDYWFSINSKKKILDAIFNIVREKSYQ